MPKLGVGIGEDFPVNDPPTQESGDAPRDDRAEFEEWKRRRAEWRARKEERRRQRDEWRARKRAFKSSVRAAVLDSLGSDWGGRPEDRRMSRHRHWLPFWLLGLFAPVIALLVLLALVVAVFTSPFLFLALVLLSAFFFAHRRHHRHAYYDFDMAPAQGRATNAPTSNEPIVMPPPRPSASQSPTADPGSAGGK